MTKEQERVIAVLKKLQQYVEEENFKGYDPYDTLNSFIPFSIGGRWSAALVTQLQKLNPINIRPILGIKKSYNPKAIGLLLHAYSLLYKNEKQSHYKKQMDFLFNWLCENYSKGYSGYCWGYNFNWASSVKMTKAFHPNLVTTTSIGNGIFIYYQQTKSNRALQVLSGIADFILDDIPLKEDKTGVCFSYTDLQKDCCYNASMLAAELLAKIYSVTKEENYLLLAQRAVDFVVARQHDNGKWNYSLNLKTGKEREQIDFHQGYILDSLHEFMHYSGIRNEKYLQALENGTAFYKEEQFFLNGQSKWRLPKLYPADIHCQSQGIIVFSKLNYLHPEYLRFATCIIDWTLENMKDEKGYFYYRKYKSHTNKISYMRWSQAWMMLALAEYLNAIKD